VAALSREHGDPMNEVKLSIAVTIVASLLSGILGVVISTVYHRLYEKRRMKIETLKAFVGYRYDVTGDSFSRALNEVFLVFHDSPRVLGLLSEYHSKVTARQPSEDGLVRLFKAMCDNVGVSYGEFNDSFFLQPFNARPSTRA